MAKEAGVDKQESVPLDVGRGCFPAFLGDYIPAYWHSGSLEDESRMTMQVAFVATDGIVLASDTKWAHTPRRGNMAFRDSALSTKILVDADKGVAIGCSMNMELAIAIAEAMLKEFGDSDWLNPSDKAELVGQRFLDSAEERNLFQCLIVTTKPTPRLYRLESATVNMQSNQARCREILDKCVGGDNANAAVFWSERYYRQLPMADLAALAAQLITDAAPLNSGFIDGLEIMLCDTSGPRWLPQEEVSKLGDAAKGRSKMIGESLFGSRC